MEFPTSLTGMQPGTPSVAPKERWMLSLVSCGDVQRCLLSGCVGGQEREGLLVRRGVPTTKHEVLCGMTTIHLSELANILGNNVILLESSISSKRRLHPVRFTPPAHTRLNPTLASFDSITRFKLGTCSYLMPGLPMSSTFSASKIFSYVYQTVLLPSWFDLLHPRIFDFQKTTNARISSSFVLRIHGFSRHASAMRSWPLKCEPMPLCLHYP